MDEETDNLLKSIRGNQMVIYFAIIDFNRNS